MDYLALWLSAGSAFFAALAALANLRQARKASQGNEVSVYLRMLEIYGSTEMRFAISSLAKFWRENNGEVSAGFKQLNDTGKASELRGNCRLVSSYFVNAARLYEAGLISRKLLKLLILHPGLNVFYNVAEPINVAKNEFHNAGRYKPLLMSVVKQHGDGRIY